MNLWLLSRSGDDRELAIWAKTADDAHRIGAPMILTSSAFALQVLVSNYEAFVRKRGQLDGGYLIIMKAGSRMKNGQIQNYKLPVKFKGRYA